MHNLRMDTWQAEYDAGLMYAAQYQALQEQELQSYMNRRQIELMNTQLNAEERLRLEQEYATAYQTLQDVYKRQDWYGLKGFRTKTTVTMASPPYLPTNS